jgi:hypothetical protein
MLNNIHSFSFRPRIVNINWTNIGLGAPPEWGVPLSIPRAIQGEWVRVATEPRPPQPFGRWPDSMTIWPGTFSLETHLIWQQGDEA